MIYHPFPDLIGQAKSGTGKTLVFTIIALEKVRLNDDREGAAFAVPPPQVRAQDLRSI